MIDLARTILRARGGRWPAYSAASLAGVGLLFGTVYAGAPTRAAGAASPGHGAGAVSPPAAPTAADLEELRERVDRVRRAWSSASRYYEAEVAPIERVLLQYRPAPVLAERVAVALVREANRVGLDPRLLLAVLLVENPWLDPDARSPVGAIGLMQVMPLHRGAWRACPGDLEDLDANICYGARIFAHYFRRSNGDVERALLRYNGCVHGTNTPNCHRYPHEVFARAGRASVLAWLRARPGAAAP